MKAGIIVWSLTLLIGSLTLTAMPARAQHPTESKPVPAATAAHPEAGKPAAKHEVAKPEVPKPEAATHEVAKPAAKTTPKPTAKPEVPAKADAHATADAHGKSATAAEKPAAPKPSVSNASAAERILERLDKEFPYRKPNAVPRSAGTTPAAHASNRVTLNWKLSLRWPDEIAPKAQTAPLGPV
ncbi:MAG: hypothetical protein KAY59_01755, partial [Acidobacteria bacterium]|nr:hypothetical protein [Acidobacteriota bacterium]